MGNDIPHPKIENRQKYIISRKLECSGYQYEVTDKENRIFYASQYSSNDKKVIETLQLKQAISSEYVQKCYDFIPGENNNQFAILDPIKYTLYDIKVEDMPFQRKLEIISQLLNGIIDIHKHEVFHGSLNYQNIGITSKGTIKICGEVWNDITNIDKTQNQFGSNVYKNTPYEDSFAIGMIILTILFSSRLINKGNRKQMYKALLIQEFNSQEQQIVDLFKIFLEKMEEPNTFCAPYFENILRTVVKILSEDIKQTVSQRIKDFFNFDQEEEEGKIRKGIQFLYQKKYLINQFLGQGSFGIVFQGKQHVTQRIVAIKLIYTIQKSIIDECQAEAEKLSKVNSESVIKLFDSFYDAGSGFFFFITEMCDKGTLMQYLEKENHSKLEESFISKIVAGLMNGLIDLHKVNIIHSDLKLDNILLSSNEQIKICDFGLSVFIESEKSKIIQKGSNLQNCAPEQLQELVGKPSDVYSSGIILIQLLFPNIQTQELMQIKRNGKIPKHNTFPHLRKLAKKMTKEEAKERFTPSQVLKELMLFKLDKELSRVIEDPQFDSTLIFSKVDKYCSDLKGNK